MPTNPAGADLARVACSAALAEAIERLRALLVAEFGADHAFVVSGRGDVLGAASSKHGVIVARAATDLRPAVFLTPVDADF